MDREFVNMFMIYDENSSWYLDDNIAAAGVDLDEVDHEEFEESNLKHTINGFLWDNFPEVGGSHAMTMKVGERVRLVPARNGDGGRPAHATLARADVALGGMTS